MGLLRKLRKHIFIINDVCAINPPTSSAISWPQPIDTESVEVRSLRLYLVSAEAEIDRLRERTASLATRLTTLERSQNADSMKHEGAATARATLTERISMIGYYGGAAPEPSDDHSEGQ